jgi:hypothetical protein
MPKFCGLDYRVLYNLYALALVILTVIDIPLILKKVKKRQSGVEQAYQRIANYLQSTHKGAQEGLEIDPDKLLYTINDRLGAIDKKIAENGRYLDELRRKLQYEIIDPEEKHKVVEEENRVQKDTDELKIEEAQINKLLKEIDNSKEGKEVVQYSHFEIVVLNAILIFLAIVIPGVHTCYAALIAMVILGLIVLSGILTWKYLIKEK